MLAVGVPSSFLRSMVPATAVYGMVWPLIWMECSVLEVFSSILGGGVEVLFSSAAAGGGVWRLGPRWAETVRAMRAASGRMAKRCIWFDCSGTGGPGG